jgi:hypothetical protein
MLASDGGRVLRLVRGRPPAVVERWVWLFGCWVEDAEGGVTGALTSRMARRWCGSFGSVRECWRGRVVMPSGCSLGGGSKGEGGGLRLERRTGGLTSSLLDVGRDLRFGEEDVEVGGESSWQGSWLSCFVRDAPEEEKTCFVGLHGGVVASRTIVLLHWLQTPESLVMDCLHDLHIAMEERDERGPEDWCVRAAPWNPNSKRGLAVGEDAGDGAGARCEV